MAMGDGELLTRLIAQAEDGRDDLVMIRALVEEACDLGTGRAMERLGLSDHKAEADVRELRELLGAWRDAKKAVRSAVIGWLVRGCLALILIGIAVKIGLFALVKG